MFLFNSLGVFQDVNAAAVRFLEDPKEILLTKSIKNYARQDLSSIFLNEQNSLWNAERNIEIDFHINGQVKTLDFTIIPCKWDEKTCMLGFGKDITEQKRKLIQLQEVQADLIKSQQKFKLLVDFTHDWEYWRHPEGSWIYSSPACQRITGYSPAEFYAKPDLFLQIIISEDRHKISDHHKEIQAKKDLIPIELRIMTKAGEIKWIDHVCVELFSEDGTYIGRRGSNRDISARKKAEEELQNLRQIIPICASCKKIRDDQGYWEVLEEYLATHSDISFTHGMCPACTKKFIGDL